MPEMVLMRVDLPAPLSPTSAVTWPAWAAKSTALSACTAPKRLLTPRSSRSGVLVATAPPSGMGRRGVPGGRRAGGPAAHRGGQEPIPAAVQAEAAGPAQMSVAFRKLSAMMVSLTLSLVTG